MNLFTYTELLETTAALFLHSIPIMSTFEMDVYQTIMVRLILDLCLFMFEKYTSRRAEARIKLLYSK